MAPISCVLKHKYDCHVALRMIATCHCQNVHGWW